MSTGARRVGAGAAACCALLAAAPAARASPMGEALVQVAPDFTAATSGNWSDPATWSPPQVPARAGGKLHVAIPAGKVVTVDGQLTEIVDTLRLEGTLAFAPDLDTRLTVDTLVSLGAGTLQIGTAASPISAERTAEISIADVCPTGTGCFASADAEHLGQGLILNGPVRVFGAPKDAFKVVTDGFQQGRQELLFQTAPAGWRVNDEIVLPPTRFNRIADRDLQEAEKLRISSIALRADGLWAVGLSQPLQRDHTPHAGMAVHAANLTRNAVIRSRRAPTQMVSLDQRGHVMIHSAGAQLQYVELRNLGRTDKTLFNDDPGASDPPAVENNKRGRYPLHFHRVEAAGASIVTGAVVNTSPGWGFVNHGSSVMFDGCVSFNADGAGFVAETGGEIGRFAGNIAIQGIGAPDGRYRPVRFEDDGYEPSQFQAGRNKNGDLAFTGDGFWIQSPAVRVLNNVAAGFQGNAFALWNMGLFEPDLQAQAGLSQHTVDHVWGDGAGKPAGSYRSYTTPGPNAGKALPNDFPAREFRSNVAYASFIGFRVRFHNHSNTRLLIVDPAQTYSPGAGVYTTPTTLGDLTAWNNEIGMGLSYVLNLNLVNAKVLSDQPCPLGDAPGQPTCFAIVANKSLNGETSTTRFDGLEIAGYRHAIDLWQTSPQCEVPPRFCLANPDIAVPVPGEAIQWGNPGDAGWLPAIEGCSPTPPPPPPECD